MSTTEFKKFKVQYTNGTTQERITEEPRFVISADMKTKSLWISDTSILATVPYENENSILWAKAKERIQNWHIEKRLATLEIQ